MAESSHQIRIIAQPQAFYRERYMSEMDKHRNRAQRFIRADKNPEKIEYPTIEIPREWCNPNRQLFIRVTLVTVSYKNVPVTCVHPYEFDTEEVNVLKDSASNSIYFPITEKECNTGRKTFMISRKKRTQYELRSYGLLRILDSEETDIQRVTDPHNAKQLIETYRLWESQLVFCVAEIINGDLPLVMAVTRVFSQVTSAAQPIGNDNEMSFKFAPQKGDWQGGDDVLMVIPNMDKRKTFSLRFEYPMMDSMSISVEIVDTKTISFQTPPCLILLSSDHQSLEVPIVVTQGDEEIVRVNFLYQSTNLCQRCLSNASCDDANWQANKKRAYLMSEDCELDFLRPNTKPLTISQSPCHKTSSSVETSRLERYFGQLQESVVDFVRTNSPAQLFRRTSVLLAECRDDPPPLDDAIRHGHIELALTLIEQAAKTKSLSRLLERTNNDGEIPLLLAAKLNQWALIELILSQQPELARQIDKHDNNLLHLLANISNDDGQDTIKHLLSILPVDTKNHLMSTRNQDGQTPVQLAKANQNRQCAHLLTIHTRS